MDRQIESCQHRNKGIKGKAKRQQIWRQKQSGRQTERQKDRETDRQRDRETERQRDRETGIQRDRKTERQKDRETERQNDIDIIYILDNVIFKLNKLQRMSCI